MYSHVYFVDGLLIDTGHSRKRRQVFETTKKLPVDQMFVTHHHEDHTGNILAIQKQFGCDVFASEHCCELMKDPPKLSLAQKLFWGDRPAYPNLISISDTIETKNHRFKIIPIKGHAEDMVALYEAERKWLFSADLYVTSRTGYFLKNESMLAQIESMRKILALEFDAMFCSHNPKLENAKQNLQEKLDNFEEFFDNVSRLHHKGHSSKEIFKMLDLKEQKLIKWLSFGQLSRLNMVESVIRDIHK